MTQNLLSGPQMKMHRAWNSLWSSYCFNFEWSVGTMRSIMTDQTPCQHHPITLNSSSNFKHQVHPELLPYLRAGLRTFYFYLSCLLLLFSFSVFSTASAVPCIFLLQALSTCGCLSYRSRGNSRICSRSSRRKWIWRRGKVRQDRSCRRHTRWDTPQFEALSFETSLGKPFKRSLRRLFLSSNFLYAFCNYRCTLENFAPVDCKLDRSISNCQAQMPSRNTLFFKYHQRTPRIWDTRSKLDHLLLRK